MKFSEVHYEIRGSSRAECGASRTAIGGGMDRKPMTVDYSRVTCVLCLDAHVDKVNERIRDLHGSPRG